MSESDHRPASFAVIGGGISGLTAAWELNRRAKAEGRSVSVRLFEASERLGGVIRTERVDGITLECGPDCFISTKPEALELSRQLGLEAELISTRPEYRRSFVLHRGKLSPIPAGFFLIAPTSLGALARTKLLSWPAKLRAALELLMPNRQPVGATAENYDESLASFVRRRFGSEVLKRIAQPMVGGIYTADPEKLSLAATFPQFLKMEREHGSVIRGLMRQRKNASGESGTRGAEGAAGPRYGMFVSFRDGMQTLTDRIASELPEETQILDVRVSRVSRCESGGFSVELAGEDEPRHFDGVIMALPAHTGSKLLGQVEEAAGVEYASCAIVNMVFRKEQIRHAMGGAGFVVPLAENRSILAASFMHHKWPGRVPEGLVNLRVFVGGAVQGHLCRLEDGPLVELVTSELDLILGVTGEPMYSRADRWSQSMAQYEVGHLAKAKLARQVEGGGLVLAGNGFEGVGIPDCIRVARSAVDRAWKAVVEGSSQSAGAG